MRLVGKLVHMKANTGISENERKGSRIDYVLVFILLLYWTGVVLRVLS